MVRSGTKRSTDLPPSRPRWLISAEKQAWERRPFWIVQLMRGDQVVLAAAGGQGFATPAAAKEFTQELRAALHNSNVRRRPTIEERVVAEERLALERLKEQEARRAREASLWQEAEQRAQDENWTEEDWDRFVSQHEGDEDDWDYIDEEKEKDGHVSARSLEWEVSEGEGRPQAVLFAHGRSVLSTTGLLRIGEVNAVIEWLRTKEALAIPIERA